MVKSFLTLIIFILPTGFAEAQQIRVLTSGRPVSLRGLSVVNDQIIWVSGSGGSVGVSTDAGENWKWIQVHGFEKTDFRDIEAFSDQEAVIMGITEPAVILRTTDGGKNWITTLKDTAKSVFLDAMDFSGDEAVLVGDPDKEKIFFARSSDRGKSWVKSAYGTETTVSDEAFFAASGSNIKFIPGDGLALISGGKKSCLYLSTARYVLDLNQGEQTTGANSIAINSADPNQAFIVGGDFSHDTSRYGNSLRIQFHPFVQTPPMIPPHGYRSCVEYLNNKEMICCGTSGVDFTNDGGVHWTLISGKSFHVCRKSKSGKSVFLAGPKGAVAILEF